MYSIYARLMLTLLKVPTVGLASRISQLGFITPREEEYEVQ
jgi:hypothetical protein